MCGFMTTDEFKDELLKACDKTAKDSGLNSEDKENLKIAICKHFGVLY